MSKNEPEHPVNLPDGGARDALIPARVPEVNFTTVPQIMVRLMSKLAQVNGYCQGLQDGVQGSGIKKDHPEIIEPFEKGLAHLIGLIDEACSIEQELRAKLRTRGEEV